MRSKVRALYRPLDVSIVDYYRCKAYPGGKRGSRGCRKTTNRYIPFPCKGAPSAEGSTHALRLIVIFEIPVGGSCSTGPTITFGLRRVAGSSHRRCPDLGSAGAARCFVAFIWTGLRGWPCPVKHASIVNHAFVFLAVVPGQAIATSALLITPAIAVC